MWADVEFSGRILSRVYYEIVDGLLVPEGSNLEGHGNGIILYMSDRPSDQNTMAAIINAIDDANAASRNYLMAIVRSDLRDKEYIPDMISLIRKGIQHVESEGSQAVPVNFNDSQLIRVLFDANRESMTAAVEELIRDMDLTVELHGVDFKQEDN